jgi:hypothetical protein
MIYIDVICEYGNTYFLFKNILKYFLISFKVIFDINTSKQPKNIK